MFDGEASPKETEAKITAKTQRCIAAGSGGKEKEEVEFTVKI